MPAFVTLTVVLGFFMAIGMAAVYKHIPVYYPDHVGAVGGLVGAIGGLGGFFLPIAFGVMNDVHRRLDELLHVAVWAGHTGARLDAWRNSPDGAQQDRRAQDACHNFPKWPNFTNPMATRWAALPRIRGSNMSQFLDRLTFFKKYDGTFSDGHGVTTTEDRQWENAYRQRWSHDKIVRSTHGVNCTGSCSWKIYVKGGIVTWETQQTDYPRTRPELPNHEPRGCSRGASYSWYLYSGNRLKYPMVRGALFGCGARPARRSPRSRPGQSIVEDEAKRKSYTSRRGLGGFVRSRWDEANEIIAAANAYTISKYGPDRIAGFSPIPAMSMVSYAAGTRYLSLLGGVCLSFYDWYCDLPPASPQTWGEQTDVPESADWYNAGFLLLWGSNVPQTRTPDAHFYTEARYRGAKSVVITPDYSEAAKFGDLWLHPKQGTDSALAMAFGHVILKEFHVDRQTPYFTDYCRKYSDMPFLVRLIKQDGRYVPERFLRASDLSARWGRRTIRNGKRSPSTK